MVYNKNVQTGLGKDQKLLVGSFYKVKTKKNLALFIQDHTSLL